MPSRGWLTPDTLPSDVVCRTLKIPDDLYLLVAVSGALLDLTYPDNWEQFGDQTPEDTAAAMYAMLRDFWVSQGNDCVDISLATCEHVVSQGTNGGSTPAANTDGRIPFTTFIDHPAWIGLSSNVFTIDPGYYWLKMEHEANPASGRMWAWLANETSFPTLRIEGMQRFCAIDKSVTVEGLINQPDSFNFGFWFRSNANAVSNTGFGNPKNLSGYSEHYGMLSILRLGDAIV